MLSTIPSVWRIRTDESDTYFRLLLRVLCSLLLFLGLSHLYVEYVSVYFAYYGFAYQSVPTRLPLALSAIAILALLLRPRISDAPALTSALCHLFFLIPTAVMFVFGGLFGSIFVWTIIVQFALIFVSSLDFRVKLRAGVSLNVVMHGLFAIALVGLSLVAYSRGVFSLGFNIFEVYERRTATRLTDPGILGYLEQMGAQAALLLTAVAFHNRKWLMTIVGFGAAVLFFGYTGHKSTVFWAIFLVGFVYAARFRNKFLYLVIGAPVFAWLVVALLETTLGSELANFLIRRTLFTPVLLNHYYVMFADQFGFLEWSYSKVGLGLFEYQDTISPTQAVGHFLTGSDENSANTGMIGFGYINAGHAGVATYLGVFLAILVFAAGLAKQKQIEMLGAAIMIRSTYFAITTSDLPSTILSGGLGYAVLVLLFYPAAQKEPAGLRQANLVRVSGKPAVAAFPPSVRG